MNPAESRKGQPVLFLGLLLAGWCLVRIVTWQSPWPAVPFALPVSDLATRAMLGTFEQELGREQRAPSIRPVTGEGLRKAIELRVASPHDPVILPGSPAAWPEGDIDPQARAAGHALLWTAGMAVLPVPRSIIRLLYRDPDGQQLLPTISGTGDARNSAWRFDGWVMLRQESPGPSRTSAAPFATYGASQIGAVAAYRLAPNSAHRPAVFARLTRPLVAGAEVEGAIGARIRPIAGMPVDAHVEMRVRDNPGGPDFRPATYVTGGFDDRSLPLGMLARGSGQAGFVGGAQPTGFVDGSMVVDRRVARFDLGDFAVGAGAWGGAQRGAARIDIGPSARIDVQVGEVSARIEADYRLRVAGDARPGSGAALTISSGF